jgi:hypothetical protein
MQREVSSFPFAPSARERLVRAGFRTVGDVLELTPVQLGQGADVGMRWCARAGCSY